MQTLGRGEAEAQGHQFEGQLESGLEGAIPTRATVEAHVIAW